MKSCQTRIPSSSHSSWNAVALIAADARHPQHVHARRRDHRSEPLAALAAPAGSAGSSGVHTAPRANTGTPLTCSVEAVALESSARGSPARGTRPVRRRADARSPARPAGARRSRAGSPCVCGHHGRRRRSRSSPSPRSPRPRRRQLDAGAMASSARQLDRRRSGSRRAVERRSTPRTASTPAVAVEPRTQLAAARTAAPAAARAGPAATARRAAARAQSPARGRAASCDRSAGCRSKRARSASAPAVVCETSSSGRQRPAADRKLVARARSAVLRRADGRRTSSRCSSTRSPLRYTSATVAIPSSARISSSPARRGLGVKAGAKPPVVGVEVAPSCQSQRRPRERRAAVPGTCAGSHSRPSSSAASGDRAGRRARDLPAFRQLGGFERQQRPRAGRRWRAPTRRPARRSAARSRTGGAWRAGTTAPCIRRRSRASRRRRGCARSSEQPARVIGAGSRTPTRPSARSQTRRRGSRSSPPLEQRRQLLLELLRRSGRTGSRAGAAARWRAQKLRARRGAASSPSRRGPASKRTSSVYGGSTSSENSPIRNTPR